jgi:hypothetical protein
VTLALLIFGLVLVLNSVLYTSTVAPQAADDAASNGEMYRNAIRADMSNLMRAIADGEEYVGREALVTNMTAVADRMDESTAASEPGSVNVSLDPALSDTGSRVRQDSSADLTSNGGAENWTVADPVTSVEDFDITLDELPKTTSGSEREFRINASDGTDVWRLGATYDEDTGEVYVYEQTNGGPETEVCRYGAPGKAAVTIDINLTTGEVDPASASCPNTFTLGDGVSTPYRLDFRHAGPGGSDIAEGTYSGVVEGTIASSNFNSNSNSDPYVEELIYRAAFRIQYVTESLSYETTLTGIEPAPPVMTPNTPPMASVTVDEVEPAAGETVDFDASGSSDSDGSIAQYRWDFDGDGTSDRTTTSPTTSYDYDNPGEFRPEVTVVDDGGKSATALAGEVDAYGAVNLMGAAMSFGGYEYESSSSPPPWFSESGGSNTSSPSYGAFGGGGEDSPYETFRHYNSPGDPTHTFDVENGEYEVTLQFAEVFYDDDGDRVFDVSVEDGQATIDDLDIHDEAGGENKSYSVTVAVTVGDGTLDITLSNEVDNAAINGIVVEPKN